MKDFAVVGLRKYLTHSCLVLALLLIPTSNVLADAQHSMSEADCS
jgi:hypothetical protein